MFDACDFPFSPLYVLVGSQFLICCSEVVMMSSASSQSEKKKKMSWRYEFCCMSFLNIFIGTP